MIPSSAIVLLTLCAILTAIQQTSGYVIKKPEGQCPLMPPDIRCLNPSKNYCGECKWAEQCCFNGCDEVCMKVATEDPSRPSSTASQSLNSDCKRFPHVHIQMSIQMVHNSHLVCYGHGRSSIPTGPFHPAVKPHILPYPYDPYPPPNPIPKKPDLPPIPIIPWDPLYDVPDREDYVPGVEGYVPDTDHFPVFPGGYNFP